MGRVAGRILFAAALASGLGIGQELERDRPYVFPVRPGTPEWLKVVGSRTAAVDVPEWEVQRMTTRALVATCLDYPGKVLVTASSESGGASSRYRFLAHGFSAMRELWKRRDSAFFLVAAYRSRTMEARTAGVAIPLIEHLFIVTLMGGPGIVTNFTDEESIEVARLAAQNIAIQRAEHGPGASESIYAELIVRAVVDRKLRVELGGTVLDGASIAGLWGGEGDLVRERRESVHVGPSHRPALVGDGDPVGEGRRLAYRAALDYIEGLGRLELERGR